MPETMPETLQALHETVTPMNPPPPVSGIYSYDSAGNLLWSMEATSAQAAGPDPQIPGSTITRISMALTYVSSSFQHRLQSYIRTFGSNTEMSNNARELLSSSSPPKGATAPNIHQLVNNMSSFLRQEGVSPGLRDMQSLTGLIYRDQNTPAEQQIQAGK